MRRTEFEGLLSRYRAALDTYRARGQRMADLTKAGGQPPGPVLSAEEDALWELAKTRRELLDALKDRH